MEADGYLPGDQREKSNPAPYESCHWIIPKRMAKQFGIKPGQEMIQGIESARETGSRADTCDRNIQVTFSRIWNNLGFHR